jgi:glycosyltransferase involved in cell wall biosynthesis
MIPSLLHAVLRQELAFNINKFRTSDNVVEYNEEELCNALSEVLQNEQLSKKLGGNGQKFVEEEFGWDKGFEKLYEAIVSENRTEKLPGPESNSATSRS